MTAATFQIEPSRPATFRKEEGIGLALALAAHVGLVAAILLRPPPEAPPIEQRVTVTLADDMGLTAQSPDALAEAAPGQGAPPVAEPEPLPPPPPPPPPKPKPEPSPRITAKPTPKPLPRATATPQRRVTATPTPRVTRTPQATRTPGAERTRSFEDAFGDLGKGNKDKSGPPVIGPREIAALNGEVQRQLKARGRWAVPQGAEAERLVTIVTFRLGRDGRIVGTPTARTLPESITQANRAQVAQHQERAIRAVQLTAPFVLNPDFYSAWQRIDARFDRKTGQ